MQLPSPSTHEQPKVFTRRDKQLLVANIQPLRGRHLLRCAVCYARSQMSHLDKRLLEDVRTRRNHFLHLSGISWIKDNRTACAIVKSQSVRVEHVRELLTYGAPALTCLVTVPVVTPPRWSACPAVPCMENDVPIFVRASGFPCRNWNPSSAATTRERLFCKADNQN